MSTSKRKLENEKDKQMEGFIGEIKSVGFNFAPRDWAKCEGQVLSIAQHHELYSLIGTTYGGDGRSTFALPDLRGRVVMGEGQGPGLASKRLGERSDTSTSVGNDQRSAYLVLNYIICIHGSYPSRS